MASAAPNGQAKAPISCWITIDGISTTVWPPSSEGVTKALIASTNTRMTPASTPGRLSGSVTRHNVSQRVVPSDAEASSSAGSMLRSAFVIGSTMNGTKTCTSASTTTARLNSMRSGLSIRPSDSTIIQPKLRTSTPTSRGDTTHA